MLSYFRGALKPFFALLATPFIWVRAPPAGVTLLGIPFALACGYAYATHQYGLALLLLPLATLWDALDGTVARALKKQSLWGNYFETMIDKLVEILIFLGLAVIHPLSGAAALGFSLWSSYAKPRVGLVIITDNRDWPAIGEHADKIVLLFLGTLLAFIQPVWFSLNVLDVTLWGIAAMTGVGTLQRMAYAKKLISEAEKSGHVLPYLKQGKER